MRCFCKAESRSFVQCSAQMETRGLTNGMIVGAQEHLFDDPDLWRGGYCPNIIIFTNMYSDISISVCALKFNSEASTSTLLKRTNAFICI